MPKSKKPRPTTPCPCCQPLHQAFADLSASQDAQLEILVTLLLGQREDVELDARTASEIAVAIDSYLQRKIVREAVFFGRSLECCTLNKLELNAELNRLRAYHEATETKTE